MNLRPAPERPAPEQPPPFQGDTPFVVRGGAAWARGLTLTHLREHYGALAVEVNERDGSGDMFTNPAGQRRKGTCSLLEYLDFLSDCPGPQEREIAYQVEQTLQSFSPELLASMPAWCARSLTSVIVITARGIATGLHVDRFDGHSAQAVGAKRWVMFPPDHGALLGQVGWHCALNPDAPDLEAFPRFAEAEGLETIVHAGDVLYSPAGWFHKVTNLSDIAVSMSFFFDPGFGPTRPVPPSLASVGRPPGRW